MRIDMEAPIKITAGPQCESGQQANPIQWKDASEPFQKKRGCWFRIPGISSIGHAINDEAADDEEYINARSPDCGQPIWRYLGRNRQRLFQRMVEYHQRGGDSAQYLNANIPAGCFRHIRLVASFRPKLSAAVLYERCRGSA